MSNHETPLGKTTTSRLQLIREYVVLQAKLLSETVSKLDSSATEYDFEESLPTTAVGDDGTAWSVKAHGLGVMFVNPKTKIVVDAHVGFIDAPSVFDAWRLVQYCESKLGTGEDVKSWQETLDKLGSNGIIEPHAKHERHYVFK
ncbi:hypothetical protein AB1K70_21690 [Bremerella sp. JC770]|uniref:DUF6896 domain-containing protein n=1 Tax=Bremerella sp. JC770 TaxID=3232137 RepID=UPI00345B1D13